MTYARHRQIVSAVVLCQVEPARVSGRRSNGYACDSPPNKIGKNGYTLVNSSGAVLRFGSPPNKIGKVGMSGA